MNIRTRIRALLVAVPLCGLFASPVFAVELSVGAEPACTHADIQAAFDALPATGFHTVRIARTQSYAAQALSVTGKGVTVIGGLDDCADTTPNGDTILSGLGGGHDSVLTITGTNNDVILEHLSLIRGDEVDDGYGGGIDFRGAGFLTLRDTSVSQNHAGYGGGINVSATGGHAELRIEAGSVILNNTAEADGGGVRLWGDTRLLMLDDNSQISGNDGVYGGGIHIIAPARADIGSPGLGNNGAIFNNRASFGGGIAVTEEGGSDPGIVRLFTTDAARPVRIHGNSAAFSGGGIFLQSLNSNVLAELCAYDFRIDGNTAPGGSAIIASGDTSLLYLNIVGVNCNSPEAPAALGAVPCTPGLACNSIDANFYEFDGSPVGNAVASGHLVAERVQWRGNRGDEVLHLYQDGLGADEGLLTNCLFADNVVNGSLIAASAGADLSLDHCTLANNTIAADEVIEASESLTLRRSIIDQPDNISATAASDLTTEHVVATEIGSLGGEQGGLVVLDRPRFVDAEHGDYHQMAASRGVDIAPPTSQLAIDLDHLPRAIELEFVPNGSGIADAGAYERQGLMPIVRNPGFFPDLRQWTLLAPDSVSWLADGLPFDAGAVEIRQTDPPATQVVGLNQCIHLPGPGTYRLSGSARATGGLRSDFPSLVWSYRFNADNCIGLPTSQGELHLPHSSAFATSPVPATLESPPGQWTRNSTLVVSLKVVNGNQMVNDGVDAFFDNIVLEPVLDDRIFADGFD